jgi:hypothetical protein
MLSVLYKLDANIKLSVTRTMRVLKKILLLSREYSRGLALPEPLGLETAFCERLPAPGISAPGYQSM